ncbi:hypothetical protein FP2506_16904 [Fulvimarina pelagi HTCC2506]|uniref:Uncharacterized protein n=2 Tax=Fulvimarina pelagi TaxID=217511 RepID=Q0G2P9_9HYPH|nr:hypothetical protein FP2506_16904 [Fulvimarina pelagi HTCC2506]
MRTIRLTARELLKLCHQSWRSVGMETPRGWLRPPFSKEVLGVRFLEQLIFNLNELTKTNNDLSLRDFQNILIKADRDARRPLNKA